MADKQDHTVRHAAISNKKARFNYDILETCEAGLILVGSEVKSLRAGQASIEEAYVRFIEEKPWLVGATISPYEKAHQENHDPNRPRQLLMHRREIHRWLGKVKERGLTIVPLKLYFGPRGFAKVQVALAKGKAMHDKRKQIRDRDMRRDLDRQMRKYK
jgi:SsrA-binding protein